MFIERLMKEITLFRILTCWSKLIDDDQICYYCWRDLSNGQCKIFFDSFIKPYRKNNVPTNIEKKIPYVNFSWPQLWKQKHQILFLGVIEVWSGHELAEDCYCVRCFRRQTASKEHNCYHQKPAVGHAREISGADRWWERSRPEKLHNDAVKPKNYGHLKNSL